MASETFRVILHFRSNFETPPDKVVVEGYIAKYLEAMAGIGQVLDVEVVTLEQVAEVILDGPTVSDRTTIPAPPAPVPAVIIEEPDTGRKTRLPGTGQ